MPRDHIYFVYIVASRSRTLYIGVTSALIRRTREHREGSFDGFTSQYNINRLVYFERFGFIENAIAREKQLKGWLRSRKIALIESANPTWEDLYDHIPTWKNPNQAIKAFSPRTEPSTTKAPTKDASPNDVSS